MTFDFCVCAFKGDSLRLSTRNWSKWAREACGVPPRMNSHHWPAFAVSVGYLGRVPFQQVWSITGASIAGLSDQKKHMVSLVGCESSGEAEKGRSLTPAPLASQAAECLGKGGEGRRGRARQETGWPSGKRARSAAGVGHSICHSRSLIRGSPRRLRTNRAVGLGEG